VAGGATSTVAAFGGVAGCLIELITSLLTADTSLLQQCPMGGYGGEVVDQRESDHQTVGCDIKSGAEAVTVGRKFRGKYKEGKVKKEGVEKGRRGVGY